MDEKIEIILNGKKTTIPTNWTLDRVITDLGLKPDQIAIEFNEQILNRKRWSEQPVGQGDRIEIVHFVGGGTRYSSVR